MASVNIYTLEGSVKKGSLPKDFSAEVNMPLISQAIRVYEDNRHLGLAKVKTRSEIRLSTRKIYRQKGTGGARHGAKSANIFVGGGVVHGPTGTKRVLRLPKNMRIKAYKSTLSLKAKKGNLALVEGLSKINKTKNAKKLVEKVVTDNKLKSNTKFTLVLSEDNKISKVYFRNLKLVNVLPFTGLNAYKVFYGGFLLFDAKCFEKVQKSNQVKKEKTVKKAIKKVEKKQ